MKKLLVLLLIRLMLPVYLPAQTHIIVGNINNTRYADGAPGADWAAKVANRFTDLNCQPGEVWVSSASGTALPASVLTFPNCSGTVVRFTQGAVFQHIGIVIPAGCFGCGIIGANQEHVKLQYHGSGTGIAYGGSSADTSYLILRGIEQDMGQATGTANGFVCTRCNYLQYDSEMTGVSSGQLGTGVLITATGTNAQAIHGDFWNLNVTGNWAIGFDSEGALINESNAHVFHHCNISRSTARPGTGTIGFKWGVNSGDGKIVYCDVESYDIGYEVDGKYLVGDVRTEANSIGINFGTSPSNTYANTLWQASFIDTTPYVYGGFENSVFDPIGFNCVPNLAGGGNCNFRNSYDGSLIINLQAGKTAEQTTGIQWSTHTGTNTWFAGQTAFDDFVINASGLGTALRVGAGTLILESPHTFQADAGINVTGAFSAWNNADTGYFEFLRAGATTDQLACKSYKDHVGTERWRSCNSAINDRLETDGSGNPWIRVPSGTKNVQFYGLLQQPVAATISSVSITSNVVTVTQGNSFYNGQHLTFAALGNATFLNGASVVVTSASSTQFTASFTHANYGPTAETTGVADPNQTDTAGLITITNPAVSASYTWTNVVQGANPPVCPITPLADPNALGGYWLTVTNTTLTISVHTTPGSSITFQYGPCIGNPN